MNNPNPQDIIDEVEHIAAHHVNIHVIDRRSFLKLTGIAGTGLILGFSFRDAIKPLQAATDIFEANAYVRISTDGKIYLYSKNPEIGQGIKTAIPMIIAEELDADWADVIVEQAPINPAVYGRQSAGGSRSLTTAWDAVRQAGASARSMLIAAAARQWNVPVSECRTESSAVIHDATNRRASYANLSENAASIPLPDLDTLVYKKQSDYRLLGRRIGGVDNRDIVTGKPLFGIDITVPGMYFATYDKCPATGGKVSAANLDEIKTLPGIKDAFILEGNGEVTELMPGVAIIANSTWAAINARKQLRIEWDESRASADSWTAAMKRAREIARDKPAETVFAYGNVDNAMAGSADTIEAFYTYPFVSHAPLEPQNCTAWVRDGMAELWAPSQRPDGGRTAVAKLLGLPEDKVTVNQTRIGGGFGRRLMNDYMCEAAAISERAGVPVKLQWTREDDMLHDFYRVGGFHSFKGGIDANGKLRAWDDHFITFADDRNRPVSGGDLREGEFPLNVLENVRVNQSTIPLKIPTGPWRAPRSNGIAYAVQSFVSELAHAAGRDHLEFLLEMMGEPRWLIPGDENALNTERAAAVIRLAAEKAGWGRRLPEGRGLGLAFHFSHAGHFAEVVDVSVDASKKLTVHKVTVAGDAGLIVNLSGAENQCQGAVIDGLSTAMGLSLSIENGRIQETNFNQYPLMRINKAPQVDVHFIESDYKPTGLGEPALPPVAPALCNAIFAATGVRVRELPLSKSGFTV